MKFKRTNIEIDETKLKKARKIAGLKTTKETIDYALSRLIQSSKALKELFGLQGKINFEENYNYKAVR